MPLDDFIIYFRYLISRISRLYKILKYIHLDIIKHCI